MNQEYQSRGGKIVTATVMEFSRLLRRAAEPAVPGELIAHQINRAAKRLGITRRQARGYWYGERAVVPSELMDRARALAHETPVIEAKNEYRELRQRLARLEAQVEALLVADEDFHGPYADALRRMADGSRGADRTLD